MRNPRLSSLIFCYGTLVFPDIWRAVCGRQLPGEAAVLKGYARYQLRGEVFPGIVASPGQVVQGVLYRGAGPRMLRRLDRYEADYYRRRLLPVRDAAGRMRMAWSYVVSDRCRERLSDLPWDARGFERRHLEDNIGLGDG